MFFRGEWESGFTKLDGDGGDSAFIVYILEHWFRVLHGNGSWANPAMFYPYKGMLGWSDGLVLFEVFYTPLRWLGADELLAAEIMIILVSLVGFMTFVALVRRLFDLPLLIAVAGGLVFTFANGLYYQVDHYQLIAVWFLPGIALLAIEAWTTTSRRRSCVFGALTGGLFGLLFFTSFYIAWFCVPLGAVAVIVALVLRAKRFGRAVGPELRRLWPTFVATAIAFLVALIPFADVYLPVQGKVPSATYPFVVAAYAHSLHGTFDLGANNVMWSSVLAHFHAVFSPDQNAAVTPILLAASVVLAIVVLVRSWRRQGSPSATSVLAAALAAASVLALVLPLRYHGHSLWILMWHIPGGTAIRALWRIELMSGALAVTSLMASISDLWRDRTPRPAGPHGRGDGVTRPGVKVALAALLVLVVAEQIDTAKTANFNRTAVNSFLASVPKPPAGCRSFYMTYTTKTPVPPFSFQMDAILLSQRLNLPTLDGYTGYDPPGWNINVFGPALDANVQQWSAKYHLSGVCRLDVSDMSWAPVSTPG